ncbi:pilus assembly protein TadG-related protein [Oceaniglobus roseus]|uniref:pilus assembly protein TadG-related protein n=1 Tax=Oceaniglobus roseus TaxID=1737570 RepID=UPI000C7EC9C1|nr:pilus assembly protein TadG-related protein [Kandeliimicrobium roseum]
MTFGSTLHRTGRSDALRRRLGAFAAALRREEGGGTISALFWSVTMMSLSGVALDGANAWRERVEMQGAADAAALAAVALIDDREAGRATAEELTRRNLGDDLAGRMFTADSVKYGRIDPVSGAFREGAGDAVKVELARSTADGTGLGTYLLRVFGFDSWDIRVASVAGLADGAGTAAPQGCEAATIISTGNLGFGGSNIFDAPVCLHGATRIQGGGANFYGKGVRLSSTNYGDIIPGNVKSYNGTPSATAEEVAIARTLTPTVIPMLGEVQTRLRNELRGRDGETYQGSTLPPYFKGAKIVVLTDQNAQFVGDDAQNQGGRRTVVKDNTIYYAPKSAQFAGNTDAQNVAIVVEDRLGIGGGNDLAFRNVFFFAGGTIQAAGDVDWGDPDTFCDTGFFNTYLLARDTVSFGGGAGVYGVLAAAPRMSTGGGMTSAGGLYIEGDPGAYGHMQLGGNAHITGCGKALSADPAMPISAARPSEPVRTRRSVLKM